MHKLRQLVKQVNKTHKRLGPLVAINLLAAKAKRCILNVAPAGCGKSAATDIVHMLLKDRSVKYTSLTLAGLVRLKEYLTNFNGHMLIDDLGVEKSIWSRTSTIETLASVVHTHFVHKITATAEIIISNFQGSAAINIQPVMMYSLVQDEGWVAVVRDKVLRYYHLIRPVVPKDFIPSIGYDWGIPIERVNPPRHRGKLWYQLISIGLTQWSYARCLEHIPALLKASAAFESREDVDMTDYRLLIKLLRPMQLERYILTSYEFEAGRVFQNNVYCILVELASHGHPTIQTIAEDYKVSPSTVESLIANVPEWAWVKSNSPRRILPTEQAQRVLNLAGANQKW